MQGIAGWGGGLSEYIAADQQLVFPLPADLPRKYPFTLIAISLTAFNS